MSGEYNENTRVLKIFYGNSELLRFDIAEDHDIDNTLLYNTFEYFTLDIENLKLYHYQWGGFGEELKLKII